MVPSRKEARIAGVFYLASAAAAGFPLLYVPGLIVPNDPAATAAKVLGAEKYLHFAMVSDMLGEVLFILLVLALFRLLSGVNKANAVLMVVLAIVPVPIVFLNIVNEIATLNLLHSAYLASVFTGPQRDALAMLFLGLHGDGANLANVFFGLWLLPFGLLVIQCGLLPKILGYWLVADGVALVVLSLTVLLAPAHADLVSKLALPFEFGELAMMLWLLIWGVRKTSLTVEAVRPPA